MAGPSGGPWASGPAEILRHALTLLAKDSDANRRLAMILIDNAVELSLKTYLGLPTRITGIKIGRDRFREISESFPKLLDAIEEHATDVLTGLDLGQVDWFHRLRNELYHQGNGLTVERSKVEVYAGFAKLLLKNLFNEEVELHSENAAEDQRLRLVGEFMVVWQSIEAHVSRRDLPQGPGGRIPGMRLLSVHDLGDPVLAQEFAELRKARSAVVHGEAASVTPELLRRLQDFEKRIAKLLPRE